MIFVDELREYPSGHWCHLTTDGPIEELHAFAQKIGLKREWFQDGRIPHYDLRPSKRRKALAAGAEFVSMRDQALERRAKRKETECE